MAVTTFQNDKWITIVKEAKNQTLNSSGILIGLPREILYGPLQFNGLNFEDPYIKQSLIKLSYYIQESVNSSQTGNFSTPFVKALYKIMGLLLLWMTSGIKLNHVKPLRGLIISHHSCLHLTKRKRYSRSLNKSHLYP